MHFRTFAGLFGSLAAGIALPGVSAGADDYSNTPHGVFIMTNDADANAVIAFERAPDGTLFGTHRYQTEGRGSGGTVDPLSSQGALTLSQDRSWLFAVNAGSGTVSVFRVSGAQLELSDRVPTEGSEPNAVAQHGKLVYVLNTAGTSNVVGFELRGGKLIRIPGSLRLLSENGAESSSLAFSPNGEFLLVTERATNKIDTFRVLSDGTLLPFTATLGGAGTFAVAFAPNGTALVSETGPGAPNSSAISSYTVQSNGTLQAITTSLPTLGSANCWNAVADGHFVYTSNSASASISGFVIAANGAIAPIPGTVLALNPTGSTNLDIAVSADNRFLYSLNAGSGRIGAFAIDAADGTLTNLGTFGELPASAGFNGIAAN
jgi:6-phosphogluconolactonase